MEINKDRVRGNLWKLYYQLAYENREARAFIVLTDIILLNSNL